jgi:hypothetical protein
MPKKKRTHADALAVYHDLDEGERFQFCQALLLDPQSPVHLWMRAAAEHHSKRAGELEAELANMKPKPPIDPRLIISQKDRMTWPELAEEWGVTIATVRGWVRRAKERLAREARGHAYVHSL